MWCLLKGMPWVQLNGSRACGVLYLRHLRRNTPGDEERDSLRALGLLYDHVGTPMGRAVSLGIHESQRRMWEAQVDGSKGYWK